MGVEHIPITMDARYATMFGYTQEELEENFSDRIEALAGNTDITAYKAQIKEWYNGYRFEENAKTVYNPVSLAQFFENGGKFNNYWFSTGTPSFLMELTKQKDFNFESALKEAVPQVAFNAFEIDNIDPLTLLLQTGYITIKDADCVLTHCRCLERDRDFIYVLAHCCDSEVLAIYWNVNHRNFSVAVSNLIQTNTVVECNVCYIAVFCVSYVDGYRTIVDSF